MFIPGTSKNSLSMLHHARLLSAVPVHTSPLEPRTRGCRCRTASARSTSAKTGEMRVTAAALRALEDDARDARTISCIISDRRHWVKRLVKRWVLGARFKGEGRAVDWGLSQTDKTPLKRPDRFATLVADGLRKMCRRERMAVAIASGCRTAGRGPCTRSSL